MSLNPQTSLEPDGRVRMTWTPDLTGLGYRFYRDNVPVSIGTKPGQASTRFAAETDGRSHAYGLRVLDVRGMLEQSTYPPVAGGGNFGTAIPTSPARSSATPVEVWTPTQLRDAALVGGRIRVREQIDVLGLPGSSIYLRKTGTELFGDRSQGDGIKGRIVCNAPSQVYGLEIHESIYDGVKLADGADVSGGVVIEDNYIHDCADMGVLSGNNVSANVWVMRNVVDRVGISIHGGEPDADGHAVYTGGTTSRWYILSNKLTGNAFAIQLYPRPTDVISAGNLLIGGNERGGYTFGGCQRCITVGDIIVDSATAAYEFHSSAAGKGNAAYDSIVWNCPNGINETGYPPIPATNVRILNPLLDANGRPAAGSPAYGYVGQAQHKYLPAFDIEGRLRVSADAGCYAA